MVSTPEEQVVLPVLVAPILPMTTPSSPMKVKLFSVFKGASSGCLASKQVTVPVSR